MHTQRHVLRAGLFSLLIFLAAGCRGLSGKDVLERLPPNHPANPEALEAPDRRIPEAELDAGPPAAPPPEATAPGHGPHHEQASPASPERR